MLATLLTCKNHKTCEKCALHACCPVKFELRLQSLEADSEKRDKWPAWLVVDILGFDSNRQRQPSIT